MSLQLLTPPAQEPVSLTEAKQHLRVDEDADDSLVTSLIVTSRLHVEAALDLALVMQSHRWVLDCWPLGDVIYLPIRPVRSVISVRVHDADGGMRVLDPLTYTMDANTTAPRIVARSGYWPAPGAKANGIEIDLETGFGPNAADVPEPIRQAILILTAHWYEYRGSEHVGTEASRVPHAINALLAPYREVRL